MDSAIIYIGSLSFLFLIRTKASPALIEMLRNPVLLKRKRTGVENNDDSSKRQHVSSQADDNAVKRFASRLEPTNISPYQLKKCPPVHQPSVRQSPIRQPPVNQPPVSQPPVHQLPAQEYKEWSFITWAKTGSSRPTPAYSAFNNAKAARAASRKKARSKDTQQKGLLVTIKEIKDNGT